MYVCVQGVVRSTEGVQGAGRVRGNGDGDDASRAFKHVVNSAVFACLILSSRRDVYAV